MKKKKQILEKRLDNLEDMLTSLMVVCSDHIILTEKILERNSYNHDHLMMLHKNLKTHIASILDQRLRDEVKRLTDSLAASEHELEHIKNTHKRQLNNIDYHRSLDN